MGFFRDLLPIGGSYEDAEFDLKREKVSKSPEVKNTINGSENPVEDYIREFGYGGRQHIVSLADFLEITEDDAFAKISEEMDKLSKSELPGIEFDKNPDFERMSGEEFEDYLKDLFKANGLRVKTTPKSGDQGADLIIEEYNKKKIIQAKNKRSNVGNSAIQEVKAALDHYNGDKGIVICTSDYTNSARNLARTNDIELWDRSDLLEVLSGDNNIRDITSLRTALKAIEKSDADDNFINCVSEGYALANFYYTNDDRLTLTIPINPKDKGMPEQGGVAKEKAKINRFLREKRVIKRESYEDIHKYNRDVYYQGGDMFYVYISGGFDDIEKFYYQYLVDFCKKEPSEIDYDVNI